MKKVGYVTLLIALALGSFLYGSMLKGSAPVVNAQTKNADNVDTKTHARWEYCAVSRAGYTGSTRGGTYWVSYFKEAGVEIVEIEEKVSEQQGASIARAMAKLGEEGWEMVGQAELPLKTGRFEAIYFKRLKS